MQPAAAAEPTTHAVQRFVKGQVPNQAAGQPVQPIGLSQQSASGAGIESGVGSSSNLASGGGSWTGVVDHTPSGKEGRFSLRLDDGSEAFLLYHMRQPGGGGSNAIPGEWIAMRAQTGVDRIRANCMLGYCVCVD